MGIGNDSCFELCACNSDPESGKGVTATFIVGDRYKRWRPLTVAIQLCSLTGQPTSEKRHYLPSPRTRLTGRRSLGRRWLFCLLCRRGYGPASVTHSLHQLDTFTEQAQKSPNDGEVSRGRC
jgi:hypothetical protein